MRRIGGYHKLLCMYSSYSTLLHQSRHTWSGHFKSPGIQFIRNPWTSVTGSALRMDPSNFRKEHAVFIMMIGGKPSLPGIKSTSAYFKYFTHHPNRKFSLMIFYELVDFLSLTEKMLTAFFKISRSIFTSLNSFFKSASSFLIRRELPVSVTTECQRGILV